MGEPGLGGKHADAVRIDAQASPQGAQAEVAGHRQRAGLAHPRLQRNLAAVLARGIEALRHQAQLRQLQVAVAARQRVGERGVPALHRQLAQADRPAVRLLRRGRRTTVLARLRDRGAAGPRGGGPQLRLVRGRQQPLEIHDSVAVPAQGQPAGAALDAAQFHPSGAEIHRGIGEPQRLDPQELALVPALRQLQRLQLRGQAAEGQPRAGVGGRETIGGLRRQPPVEKVGLQLRLGDPPPVLQRHRRGGEPPLDQQRLEGHAALGLDALAAVQPRAQRVGHGGGRVAAEPGGADLQRVGLDRQRARREPLVEEIDPAAAHDELAEAPAHRGLRSRGGVLRSRGGVLRSRGGVLRSRGLCRRHHGLRVHALGLPLQRRQHRLEETRLATPAVDGGGRAVDRQPLDRIGAGQRLQFQALRLQLCHRQQRRACRVLQVEAGELQRAGDRDQRTLRLRLGEFHLHVAGQDAGHRPDRQAGRQVSDVAGQVDRRDRQVQRGLVGRRERPAAARELQRGAVDRRRQLRFHVDLLVDLQAGDEGHLHRDPGDLMGARQHAVLELDAPVRQHDVGDREARRRCVRIGRLCGPLRDQVVDVVAALGLAHQAQLRARQGDPLDHRRPLDHRAPRQVGLDPLQRGQRRVGRLPPADLQPLDHRPQREGVELHALHAHRAQELGRQQLLELAARERRHGQEADRREQRDRHHRPDEQLLPVPNHPCPPRFLRLRCAASRRGARVRPIRRCRRP